MIVRCSNGGGRWLPRILPGGRWARGSFICLHCGQKHWQRLSKSEVGKDAVELSSRT